MSIGKSHADAEGRFTVGTDNPGSPNISAGLAQLPIYTRIGGSLGYTQNFNRFDVTLKGGVDRISYQDSHADRRNDVEQRRPRLSAVCAVAARQLRTDARA